MTTYTPENTLTFVTAAAGALTGIAIGGRPIDSTNGSDYLTAANAANAFAIEFDTQWGSTAPDTFQVFAILESAAEYYRERDPDSVIPAAYTEACAAIIAAIGEARAILIAEGISIPAWPSGGGGSGNATEFQGVPIASTTPEVSQVYVVNEAGNEFDLRQLTADDILPGFAITGFSGGETVEIGATVTNPAFTASYTSIPTSANITNTDGIDSPLALTTPFTNGTVIGVFTHNAEDTITFTLEAIAGTTKTATQGINFFPRSFGGVATAGASSATASGTSAILNGGAGTLPNGGLTSSVVGQTFGPFAPSSQKIDILVPHTASPHTWKDPGTGFAFAMNVPTTFSFTNANGAVLSMDLYESTNILIAAAQSVECVS